MNMNMQHGHGHAVSTRAGRVDIGMQHGHGHATWSWPCNMDMDMRHGHGHAVWTWACCCGAVVASQRCLLISRFLILLLYSPPSVQPTDGGRPDLLLLVHFRRQLTAAVFSLYDEVTKAV
jgi:hypothetical protein